MPAATPTLAPDSGNAMTRRQVRARQVFWLTAGVVVVLDQLSKWLVSQHLALYESVPVLGQVLRLTYVRNTGAAFSLLAAPEFSAWRLYLLVGVAAVTILVLAVIVHRQQAAGVFHFLPLGLICGGAAGNLINRVRFGMVVDFIEFSAGRFHFPVFNLADSAVFLGVCAILLANFRPQRPAPPPPA